MPFEDLKNAVEALTGGAETVILDDLDLPSIMVIWEKCSSQDLCAALSNNTHPAFLVENAEINTIYISKYPNVVKNSRAYSLPLEDPAVVSFDSAVNYCRNKGSLWGLTPTALWGALALYSYSQSTPPHGNSSNGFDYNYPQEAGLAAGTSGRTLTGSGPITWNHNHSADGGITDLAGVAAEWVGGLRIVSGELQFIPNADSVLNAVGQGSSSIYWQALNSNNEFVEPGSPDSLKLDYQNNLWQISTSIGSASNSSRSCLFKNMTVANELSLPEYLKALMLYPAHSSVNLYGNEIIRINNSDSEIWGRRGGGCTDGAGAGINFLDFSQNGSLGKFRSVYYGQV